MSCVCGKSWQAVRIPPYLSPHKTSSGPAFFFLLYLYSIVVFLLSLCPHTHTPCIHCYVMAVRAQVRTGWLPLAWCQDIPDRSPIPCQEHSWSSRHCQPIASQINLNIWPQITQVSCWGKDVISVTYILNVNINLN